MEKKAKRNGAIIVAAGKGIRMKSCLPKQFILLAEKPVFIHSLKKFQHCPQVDDIVLVLRQEHIEQAKLLLEKFPFSKLYQIVAGGDKRQDSVYSGLSALDIQQYEILVVHDGVRPFVKPETISKVIEEAKKKGAAISAIPAVDTIKEINLTGRVISTLDRSRLVMAQTPQAFRAELLLKAFKEAQKANFYGTDEAALVERLGKEVYIVEGSPDNIKITSEADLQVAETLLRETL